MNKKISKIILTFIIILNYLILAGYTNAQEIEGKTYLLSIGIDEYQYFPTMKSCVNNATLIATTFNNADKNIDVALLTDSQATKTAIKSAIAEYGKKLKSSDRLVIYYSGHGGENTMYWSSLYADTSRYRLRDNSAYDESILPVDASYNRNMQLTSFELASLLKNLPTKNIVIIIDSSYNEESRVLGSPPAFQPVGQTLRPRFSIRDFNMYGMTVINSSDWQEVPLDKNFNGKMFGVFTYYLAQGVSEHACDTSKDGILNINEIFEYARMVTIQNIGIQHPQIYKGRNRDMELIYLQKDN